MVSCPLCRGLPALPPAAPLAGDGEGADLEALLVPLHPGPACLGTDLLPTLHPEAGADKMGSAGRWYGDSGTEFPRGSEAQRIRIGPTKTRCRV